MTTDTEITKDELSLPDASRKYRNRQLRENVLLRIRSLPTDALKMLLALTAMQFSEVDERCFMPPDDTVPEFDPNDTSEEATWDLILKRQKQIALGGDPRSAQSAMTFLARVYGKIDAPGAKKKGGDDKPVDIEAEVQRRLTELKSKFASHEPGEAALVDNGLKPGE